MTDRASFDSLATKWIRKITDEAEDGCHICLVGTKADLIISGAATRAVSKEEVDALAARVDLLRHDPATLERLAREEHGLVLPEDLVIVLPGDPDPDAAGARN